MALIFKREFFNVNKAVIFHVELGEVPPILYIKYLAFDNLKVSFDWCNKT